MLKRVKWGSRRDLAAREDTRVDGLPHSRDGIKVHFVAANFSGHENLIGIEPLSRNARPSVDVAHSQLAPRPYDKIRDPLLRLNSLVEVIVAVKHYAHIVFYEKRFKYFAQPEVRAVPVA